MSSFRVGSSNRHFLALVTLLAAVGLMTLSCSSEDSPTSPEGAGGEPEISGGSNGGAVTLTAIDLEKATNGHDADQAPGPQIPVGDPVTWTYVITNSGPTTLANITLKDNQLGDISCPRTSLAIGASMTCSATGVATLGQYSNVARATGDAPDGQTIADEDLSHYIGIEEDTPSTPGIDLEKATNGQDADQPTGPQIPVGDPVIWTYVIANTGQVPLTNITLKDNRLGDILSCPSASLAIGASMTCTATGVATLGQYSNVARATGDAPDGETIADEDLSHYIGIREEPPGEFGCTLGYWKNHLASWPATGYSPQDPVGVIFTGTIPWPDVATSSLLDALKFGGGKGVEGAARNLMKQAVAALLNATHPNVSYPLTSGEVISMVDGALASNDRQTILRLAEILDRDNNLGCPLN